MNTITHTKIPNDAQSGILMQNVSGVNVKANNVSHPTNAVNWWECGIRASGSHNAIICNTMNHVGRALFIDDDMRPNTDIIKNIFNSSHTGLLLNWGYVGPQGINGNPRDNESRRTAPTSYRLGLQGRKALVLRT
jgi:hypothetical protein